MNPKETENDMKKKKTIKISSKLLSNLEDK
jgi:hypothetical protein